MVVVVVVREFVRGNSTHIFWYVASQRSLVMTGVSYVLPSYLYAEYIH
jgi:hypothetical protein